MSLVIQKTTTVTPEILEELMDIGVNLNLKASKVVLSFNKRKNMVEISQVVPVQERLVEFDLKEHPHILEVFEVKDVEYIIRPKKEEPKKTVQSKSKKQEVKKPIQSKTRKVG